MLLNPPIEGRTSRSNHIGKLRSRMSGSSSSRRINPLNSPVSATTLRIPDGTAVSVNCRKAIPSADFEFVKE